MILLYKIGYTASSLIKTFSFIPSIAPHCFLDIRYFNSEINNYDARLSFSRSVVVYKNKLFATYYIMYRLNHNIQCQRFGIILLSNAEVIPL